MKLNKEKFLKTEVGTELENCIRVWDNALDELRKVTPGWAFRTGITPVGAARLNGKYIKWFSCSSSVSNTTLPGRMNTSGL